MKKNRRKILSGSRKIFFAILAMFLSLSASAQQITASGQVLDAQKEPLIGVSVQEKGTSNGAITDLDGNFTLNVKQNAILIFSYVGYKSQEVKAAQQMKITLQEDNEVLDEVVVIGYGSVKRKDVTTAISSVSTKDLDMRPIVSAGQAIQGKAAGVSVIQPNGTPGGEMSIRVRGTTSMNGSNDPLYVVDGVPVDNIKFLSPNDIESMQILKDASSASIYGSRAANGVILITTKAGAAGNAKVSLTAQFGLNKVADKVESLNAAQYKELQDEIGLVSLPDGLPDRTDWFDETYTTGKTQNYQVAVSNGNEKMKYYLSAGYLKEQGVLDISYYKRYNFRVNLENQVRKWLTVSANISYSDYTSNGGGAMGTGSNRGGVILAVINTPTYAPVWDALNPNQYYNNFYGVGNITNPLENMARAKNNKDKENRLLASGNILLTPFPELKFKSTLTLDRRNAVNTTFLDPISTAWGRNQYGEASDNRNMNTVLTFDNVLTYNKNFKKHGLEVMAGSSWTDSDYSNSWINGSHYRSDQIQTLNAANKISWDNTGTGASQWGIMSFFGRVAYNFDSKYLVTANLRADGSSKLHPDHRWGVFPSFSAAWRISSEKFMENLTWIDDLKLRGGWGQTGNQSGIGDYAYLQRYNIGRIEWFKKGGEGDSTDYANAVPTISQANLRTSDLTWETTTQTNIGLDLTILNGRLTFNADYYYKKTKNMLMNVSLPAGAAAATSIARNEGEMVNKGFELSISSKNLRGGAFTWDTDFNISFNKNEITSYPEEQEVVGTKVRTVGYSLYEFYMQEWAGVDKETGAPLWYKDVKDDKGNPTGERTTTSTYSTADKYKLGSALPNVFGGLNNTFTFKGLDLSFLFTYSFGGKIYDAYEANLLNDGNNNGYQAIKDQANYWTKENPNAPNPAFLPNNTSSSHSTSSRYLHDADFIKFKNINLGYTLPKKWTQKIQLETVRFFGSLENICVWNLDGSFKGYDVELGGVTGVLDGAGTVPLPRTILFGINVGF